MGTIIRGEAIVSRQFRNVGAQLISHPYRYIGIGLLAIALMVTIFATVSTSYPDNEIQVVSFEPTGNVDLKTNFTIKFSKEMVPKDSLDRPVLDPPLLFMPAVRGQARWVETDVLRFFPDAELLPATKYIVRVESDKTWASGYKIVNKDVYRFQTPLLKLIDLRLYYDVDPGVRGSVRLNGRLRFNYPVNPEELQRSITIKGDKDAVKSSLYFSVWPAGQARPAVPSAAKPELGREPGWSTTFELVTESFPRTKSAQTYTMTIASGLECQNCGMPLAEPVTTSSIVQPKERLVVQSVHSSSDEESGIIISVSGGLAVEEAKPFITIDPPTDFVLQDRYDGLILLGDFTPGETYTVSIAKGLPSTIGAVLEQDFSTKVKIADLRPSVAFTSRAMFLPRQGNGLMEFKTTNLSKVAVEVEQVFANNLVYFLTTGYGDYDGWESGPKLYGRSLFIKEKALDSRLNERLTTTVDIKGLVGPTAQGIFKVSVRDKEQRWISDTRYALITDIGLSARLSGDYLMVWANSLADSEPLSGVTVNLLSKNNQTLVEGKTDSRGLAVFENIKDKLAGFEPFVITAAREGDLSYLRLDESLLPISDFDVAGRPYLQSGYEAFLYTDRGVYRPGDTVHIISMVRGVSATIPPDFPYFLTIFDNQGRKFSSYRMTTGSSAVASLDFPVPDFAATGKYSVAAIIGEYLRIGQAGFLVEEFMPDRIKVSLTTPNAEYRAGDMLTAEVGAKFLFGPPAAGHQVSGHLTIETYTFSPQGWSQYSFINSDLSFTKIEINLPDTLLDDTGGHTYMYQIPEKLAAPSALKGLLSATVSELGGRGVSAYTGVVIHPYERYVGLKLDLKGYAKPGETVSASLIAVGNDDKPVALPACDVYFNRVVYNTVLKKDKTGIYRYVSERKSLVIDSTVVALDLDGGSVSFTPTDYGSYEIVAKDRQGGHSSSADFYASGWGYAPWAMTSPDKIELELDKKTFESGEKGILQVRAPFGGKLLVTVEKTSVLEVITREMKENTATLEIPIKREYFPNAYITATIIRPASDLEPNMPARAFGIVPLRLSVEEKRLGMTVTAPEIIKPKSTITVEVQIPQSRSADVTVALVDAGIMQLTDFATPDPIEFFYGKKQPALKPYDMYSFIYPKSVQSESHLGPGDKMFAAARQRHVNPITARRVKSVALWSGLLKTDAAGKVAATFTLPEFNGKLVIMAVAAQNDRFGSSTKDMIVRDKIVIQESFPRFISPNDIFDGLVTLFNNSGAAADITVTLTADGPVEFISPSTTQVTLESNREGAAVFKMKAKPAPGKVSFTITAKAGDETATASVELANRPAQPLTTLYGSGTASVETPAEFIFPGDWLATTDQYILKTSSMPAMSFARNIQYLLSYPYGCIEQTTSRLFPLLYFNDLVKVADPALFGGKGPDYFIQEGILRLTGMILPDKSFAFWPGATYGNNWSTVYASHFLIEASRAGYYVDEKLMEDIRDHLDDMAQGKKARDLTDAHRIYAAFALAKTSRLSQRIVTYLKNVDASTLASYSRYQLAGALALSGNMVEASKLVPVEVQPNIIEPETGGNFSSGVRTNAILLDILLDINPSHTSIPVLAKSLMDDSRVGRWYTTQDNAFALMALGRYFKAHSSFGYKGSITIDGDKSYPIDSTGFSLTRKDLAGRKVQVMVTSGEGTCFYYWQASGIPVANVAPEFDRGIKVRREYLDEDGSPVDLTKIKLGSRIVGVITAEAIEKSLSNVVINDLLPAGFEIENPRLKTTARLSWIPARGASIDFQDIRDDRLLIFATLSPGQPLKFYYSLRAVCAGVFKLPPIAAECMYNPLIAGSASSGLVTVVR